MDNALVISILYGLTLGIIILIVGARPKKYVLSSHESEWLFTDFFEKLYFGFLSKYDPAEICKKLGLEYDRYMRDCAIAGKEPNFPKEAMRRIIGLLLFAICVILSVVLFSVVPFFIGCAAYLLLCSVPVRSMRSAANKKKTQMINEMPRFVDLLLSALEINLPIEIAIMYTANSVPCVLSEELKSTFAETQIGAMNWQQALESIARKYEIDQLSDFVLNIITAYNKGVSVTEAVSREAYAVKQATLLRAKERTSKMTNVILFPLMLFKIVPLILLLMIPIFMQASGFLNFSLF